MRTTVTDKMRVFARQMQGQNGPYISYSTSMSKRDRNNNWENGRLFVEFQNGTQPPQINSDKGVEIEVLEGWIVFRNYPATANGQPMLDRNGKPAVRTIFGVHVKSWRYPQQNMQQMPNNVQQNAPQIQLPDSFAVMEDEPF